MNGKWYVSTLFIFLALLAGLNRERKEASNQQISLQFADVEWSSEAAHDEVLAIIKQKLEVLGVDTIEIVAQDTQQLHIRYYSNVNADQVRAFLLEENLLADQNDPAPSSPEGNSPESYQLEVSELLQPFDVHAFVNGPLVSDQEQTLGYFPFSAILSAQTFELQVSVLKELEVTPYDQEVIDTTSCQIPEVRAGPYVRGIS
ncbi:hypothetical protein [Sediminicola luteus]|uniref:Uncharacterized protein n=1 Tax=Sediminicola luteus TaxID=319238 RepID=A0A2A4G9F5_9FLAO|nr:hypothetical protein [Sediminicola luteus]PCE64402.1 hypothetical protein B7P33_08915 [Sediminicola luteus]